MKKISKELLKTYYWVIFLFTIFSVFIIINFSIYLWKENKNDIKLKGVMLMNTQLQMILVGMLVDFTRKEVLEKEIIFGAKKGIEKLEAVKNNFFGKFKDFVKKAQEINNPYIPDDIERFTEDLLLNGAEALEKTVNVDEIIHKILGEEKTAIRI